jgi:hypothetical protein
MKNIGLVIAAVIIIVLAVGGFYFMNSSKSPTTQSTNQKTQNTNPSSAKGSILNLLSGGKNVNCSITYPNNKGTGTVYVSDKKFAGEFTIKDTEGKETTGHSVSDGTYVYVWTSAMPSGIKMKFDDVKNAAQTNQSVDLNQEVGLKCNPWLPDNSKFAIPSNIKFQDMSQLLQQTQQPTGTSTGGTSPCDQITDSTAKAACVNALKGQGY